MFLFTPPRYGRIFNKRSKMWRLYTIKNPKTYKYIPDLQNAILHSRLLAPRGTTGKQPLALDDPQRLGLLSGGPAPTVQELKEKKARRGLGELYSSQVPYFVELNPLQCTLLLHRIEFI